MDIDKFVNQLTKKLPKEYEERLRHELSVICNNSSSIDLLPYFLEVADITQWAKRNGIFMSPCRGSSGGSLLSYLLHIIDLDPIQYGLPFSRFLSDSRIKKGSYPDIDSDFSTKKREQVLKYVFDKHGDRSAHVAIFSSMRLKNSFQDVFRAMVTHPAETEISEAKKNNDFIKMNQLQKVLDDKTSAFNLMRKSLDTMVPGATDSELIHGYKDGDDNYHPGLLESNKMFADWVNKYPDLFAITEKVLGLYRQIGRHAAGVVISPVSLPEIIPVFKQDGVNVIAYDKKTVAKHGLIKIDLLGVTALDYVQTCMDSLKEEGIILDVYNLPENPDMYESFLDGKCASIFQWSTSGGARFAQKLKPKSLKDLCAGVALNRPGALDALVKLSDGTEMNAAEVYLKRKTGELPVEYLHKDLIPILKETFGLMVYQENVMKVMTDLFGYTEEQADDIRSKISDKDVKAFDEVKKDAQKLLNKGWDQVQIDELYNQILAFSKFGFNLSHSAGYGMLSYITAWLKYHYPLNWWAAVLTHSSEDEINSYWSDIYQYVGSPSVSDLSSEYKIKNGKLIPPISCIKGIGDAVIAEINKNGPYATLEDFFEKTSRRIINVGVVQKLVITGALDSLLGREFHSPESKLRYVFALLKKNDKDNLPEKFQNLNPFEWYLELKRTLPSSAASLYQAIKKTPEVKMPFITKDLGENVFGSALRGKYVLVNGKGLQSLINEMSGMGKSYVEVCAYGYVKSLRRFSYKGNTRSAIEVNIDFDHLPIKLCIWPGWEDKEPECNSYLTDKEAYLFTLKISSVEGKEVQVTKVNKILIEKVNKL